LKGTVANPRRALEHTRAGPAGLGLTLGALAAESAKYPGEKADVKSLPASVQETIKEKAAGGQIMKIAREDDPDGKWNCEVFVQANGKELGFELDPNGKFVKNHV
jgi:hypothetical protein